MALLVRVVFDDEALPQRGHVAFLEIEVRSGDYFSAFIGGDPVDNLRCVGAQERAVVFVEWFFVFAGEGPDVGVTAVANVFEIFFEADEWG